MDFRVRVHKVQGQVMDDDTFKVELLDRLDKILELLSLFCLPEATLDESASDLMDSTMQEDALSVTGSQTRKYLIIDEMQEDYVLAMQRWKAEKSS